jgi:hypothetical protein
MPPGPLRLAVSSTCIRHRPALQFGQSATAGAGAPERVQMRQFMSFPYPLTGWSKAAVTTRLARMLGPTIHMARRPVPSLDEE